MASTCSGVAENPEAEGDSGSLMSVSPPDEVDLDIDMDGVVMLA